MASARKGQSWIMDFILALVIIATTFTLFMTLLPNVQQGSFDMMDRVVFDCRSVSESLMHEGSPVNWTNETVLHIGIVDDGILNVTKLTALHDMVDRSYFGMKSKLNIRADFAVVFRNSTQNIQTISGITLVGPATVSLNGDDLAGVGDAYRSMTRRVVLHNGRMLFMDVYAWR